MRVHIVQKGDTLWKIAKQYGIGFEELKRLNAQLANPDYIVPGMEIFLPETGEMVGKEVSKGDKKTVVKSMKEKEMEWKPTKELQYVEEKVEAETQHPAYNPYAFMPSVYQMTYMPTYQQPIYQMPVYQQPVYQQPVYQEPTYQHPVMEESTSSESVEQVAFEEMTYEHAEYQQPMYHQPMHHPSPCGCQEPMYYQPPCGCHQPMHHHPSYGCHQPMHHHPMHHQPMYYQPMYHHPMYHQPMYHHQMYQPDVCESSRPFCPENEEQVKGYYEEMKQMENVANPPCAPTHFPYPTQQHWQ